MAMTRRGVFNAMNSTLIQAQTSPHRPPSFHSADKDDPTSLAHLQDMHQRAVDHVLDEEAFNTGKANRWLGYMQGVLVARQLATLEDVKQINIKHRDD